MSAGRIDILHRMHRAIDLTRQQCAVEFLGPQCLAADFGERDILHAVARGLDRNDLDRIGGPAMRPGQRVAHHIGLDERKRRSARAESELRMGHAGPLVS
jgi:hypothetical protein